MVQDIDQDRDVKLPKQGLKTRMKSKKKHENPRLESLLRSVWVYAVLILALVFADIWLGNWITIAILALAMPFVLFLSQLIFKIIGNAHFSEKITEWAGASVIAAPILIFFIVLLKASFWLLTILMAKELTVFLIMTTLGYQLFIVAFFPNSSQPARIPNSIVGLILATVPIVFAYILANAGFGFYETIIGTIILMLWEVSPFIFLCSRTILGPYGSGPEGVITICAAFFFALGSGVLFGIIGYELAAWIK